MGIIYPHDVRHHQCLYVSHCGSLVVDLTYKPCHLSAVLCWSADAQHLAAYHHYDFYQNVLLEVTLKITVAWGWLMFTINTVLTGAIFGKILCVPTPLHL